jgi:hypothetical protein
MQRAQRDEQTHPRHPGPGQRGVLSVDALLFLLGDIMVDSINRNFVDADVEARLIQSWAV